MVTFDELQRIRVWTQPPEQLFRCEVQILNCWSVTVVVDVRTQALGCIEGGTIDSDLRGECACACREVVSECADHRPRSPRPAEMSIDQQAGTDLRRSIDDRLQPG